MFVAVMYDLPHWILGDYAGHVKVILNNNIADVSVQTFRYPSSALELWRICRKFDVVHFLSPGPYYRFHDIVPIASVCTVNHISNNNELILFRAFHEKADALATTSRQWHERLSGECSSGSSKIFVHPLGLDTKLFKYVPGARSFLQKTFGLSEDTLILGFSAKKSSDAGNRKGIDRLWKALRVMVDHCNGNVKLFLFGPDIGSFRDGWSAGDVPDVLAENVTIPGFLERADLPLYYSGLDFYLCLSRAEGGPYPVMECMACNVIPISTSVGIVADLVQDGHNGFLVDQDNYLDRIPLIIDQCARDNIMATQIRLRARDSVVRQHSWDSIASADLFLEIYSYALNRWKRKGVVERAMISTKFLVAVLRDTAIQVIQKLVPGQLQPGLRSTLNRFRH